MDRVLPTTFAKRWENPADLIQIVIGPRQVGKTTAITRRLDPATSVYASADLPSPPTTEFIVDNWNRAVEKMESNGRSVTLILDEIQKIPRWSEVVKKLWDESRNRKLKPQVWLLGSSAILIEKGLSESLTGRFETSYFPHWVFSECNAAFETTLNEYIRLGGYPGAYRFREDLDRGIEYLQNSIVEPTLGRDILALHSVDKPALLRQLFWYVSRLPAHTVSFEKILGHLQGKGNSATLVHYAELLKQAFLVLPLAKFSPTQHRAKRSVPKWILPNPALVDPSVSAGPELGFVLENLIGGHLANLIFGSRSKELQYWREENQEIDFVLLEHHAPLFAVEVKSGRIKKIPSSAILDKRGLRCPLYVVHSGNMESFLSTTSIEQIVKLFGKA